MKNLAFLIFLAPAAVFSQEEEKNTENLLPVYVNIKDTLIRKKLSFTDKRVTGSEEIKLIPVESIDDVLELEASVDIRKRGSKGVQADINLRGGNFDQVQILLNGIPVNNPQTGHHGLDLPVDTEMIERIEISDNASEAGYGANAYSGTVNIITKSPSDSNSEMFFKAGQFGYLKAGINISKKIKKTSVYNGFSYQRSTGYPTGDSINNTDFSALKNFMHVRYEGLRFPVDFQAGFHKKDFGANRFYTAKYPWQYEKTKGVFVSLKSSFYGRIQLEPELSYKLHYDNFQLFRESIYRYQNGYFINGQDTAQYAPGIYYPGHNYHKTQVILGAVTAYLSSNSGYTIVRTSVSNEKIMSNKLGKELNNPVMVNERIVYTKHDSRIYQNFYLGHFKKTANFFLEGNLNYLVNNHFGGHLFGGGVMKYMPDNWQFHVAFNASGRLPTFTDLYYEDPSHEGNPGLRPERAFTYETGAKFSKPGGFFSVNLFWRDARNTIDWIKADPGEKWQARNLTRLQTKGLEIRYRKKFHNGILRRVSLAYAYLKTDKLNTEPLVSKYVLDYLKHKFVVKLSHKFFGDTQMHWTGIYKNRNGQYPDYADGVYKFYDYKPYFLTHVKILKEFQTWHLGIRIENLFDARYRDLSYVIMPGRWWIVEVKIDVKKLFFYGR